MTTVENARIVRMVDIRYELPKIDIDEKDKLVSKLMDAEIMESVYLSSVESDPFFIKITAQEGHPALAKLVDILEPYDWTGYKSCWSWMEEKPAKPATLALARWLRRCYDRALSIVSGD